MSANETAATTVVATATISSETNNRTALRTASTSSNQSANQLTDDEVNHLVQVMQRAKKFDEEEVSQRKTFAGQLYKYTNVVKGWQHRWFLINDQTKMFEYFMNDEDLQNRIVRGCLSLAGLQVCPSEEDSRTFTVISKTSESYKLKAQDVKTRQLWVDHLRLAALQHEELDASNSGSLDSVSVSSIVPVDSLSNKDLGKWSLEHVGRQLHLTQQKKTDVVDLIEDLTSTDVELLTIKANMNASLSALEQCFYIIKALHSK